MSPGPDPEGATPLTWEEQQAIKLTWVTTRAELNEAEQDNIVSAHRWAHRRRRPDQILNEAFVCELHRRMFGEVWRWAGAYRTSARNLGVDHWEIRPCVRDLLADTTAWIAAGGPAPMPPDEAAVRFHHRLVWIHPFPNGNGRHARLAADLLVVSLDQPEFSWGRVSLVSRSETRDRYIAALQAADAHDIGPLLAFARS